MGVGEKPLMLLLLEKPTSRSPTSKQIVIARMKVCWDFNAPVVGTQFLFDLRQK
jgi:hypothetical protein